MADIFEYVPSESEPWYKPGKSIQEFHDSTALVRVLVGGRGSGKTSAICVEAVCKHCWNNPGAKVYLLRKTELSQEATSIETFNQVFGELGPLYQEGENSLFQKWNDAKTIRVPSRIAIEKYEAFKSTKPSKSEIEMWLKTEGNRWCSFLEFKGIPDAAKRDNKLRGFEASLLIMIEADLLELADFQMMGPCLRWKGADGKFIDDLGIILDTNPPGTKHWIAKLEEQETQKIKKGEKSLFKFWHISTYENEHNLPKGYIENSIILPYQNNPPMLERMLWGRYADAFDGQSVFHEFNMALHTGENLEFPKGAYLVRGWDFGQSNAVVWSAYWVRKDPNDASISNEFWWDLHEQVLYESDVEKQCKGVMEITAKEFPFWNDRTICLGLLDFCDPAGAAKKDTGSSIHVLNTYGIYPGYKHKDRGIPKTIAIMNRLLAARTKQGEVVYKIDKINCPVLYAARAGGFRYPRENEPNYGSGLPKKDGVYDHVSDSSRYAVINCMRLDFMDVETKKDNAGILAANPYKNPAKRYK